MLEPKLAECFEGAWMEEKTKIRLFTLGINVRPLPDFIHNEVIQTIQRWKANPPQQPRTKDGHITLPESCWFLQLIDYFYNKGLLK